MSPSQTHQAPSDDGESLGSASKKKKSSRTEKHKKSKEEKSKKHKDGKSKEPKEGKSKESKDGKTKEPKDGKTKDKKKKDKSKKADVDITPSSSVVPTPQKQSASKVLPSSQRELSPESPVQNAPAPQMRTVPTPQKAPASTPQKQRAYTPQKQPTKTVSPTRLEVQIPSSSRRREEYVEMTLDSNDESVEVTPTADPRTNPKFLSGMQLLRKEVTSPFIAKNQDVFGPVIPTTPKSQAGNKPSSGKKSKSECIKKESVKKEKVPTPSSAKKKKKNDRYIPDPAEVVQLSSGDDSDSDLELQAIYDTPKRKSASKATTPSKQSIAAAIKAPASSGTVDDSDVEFQAIRKTPPSRNRSQSQPPSAKVSMTAQRSVSTPTKSSQVATPSSRSARASASKPDGKDTFQERARRCRTMSPSLATDKTSGSTKQQQAAKPMPVQTHKPTAKGTPAAIKHTDCIDLTQTMTSDDESFEKNLMARFRARKEALRTTQTPVVEAHTGKKRSWEEMHSSSPVSENDNPPKKRKLESVVSRIVRNSLREEEKPVNGVETFRQRRRRESAEALAYFHLTGWKKLDKKNKRSPVASKTKGITSLFSWTEVRKLKKMLREKAD
ncbi:unnamed protein product [Clonostachys byssicola]|uniref:Uncharacterized protein n=1 Tax=Clonostachys byssicola TaxID=160290 RepID=A0A9N9UCI5_9HYPO|nr:unnamed protein product [Clonostachys byssicola]